MSPDDERQQLTDDVVRSKFDAAQQMRLDGKGRSEGRDFCGSKAQSAQRSDMLNLLFILSLGPQIQNEFRPGFFDLRGSFNQTVLRGSWNDIERKCNVCCQKRNSSQAYSHFPTTRQK